MAALITTDPVEATRRHHHARDRRRVCRPTRLPDGMAGIWAVLPAPDAIALDTALDAAARAQHAAGDRRSTDQLRADILASVGHSALSVGWIGAPPTSTGSEGSDAGAGDRGRSDRGQTYRLGAIRGAARSDSRHRSPGRPRTLSHRGRPEYDRSRHGRPGVPVRP